MVCVRVVMGSAVSSRFTVCFIFLISNLSSRFVTRTISGTHNASLLFSVRELWPRW